MEKSLSAENEIREKSMAGSLVENALCVIMVIIVTRVAIEATARPPLMPISPSTLPSSLERGEYDTLNSEVLDDYGIWNPTPSYGGGDMAPIPHGEVD